jgi:predicted nuclease of predicted toxin-antitoxin system
MADLYTNENFPLPAAEELRRLGHNVMTVQESGLGGQSITDDEVLRFATGHRRVVVTLNRRHFVRLHDEGSEHAGIVVCTVDNDFIALAGRIDVVIRENREFKGWLFRVNSLR